MATTPTTYPRRSASNRATQRIEAIDVRAKRFGYFPRLFVWRGQHFDVQTVERCWSTSKRQWGNRVERHYFRVRCPEGTFELFQNLTHNTWHLARFEPAR
jgi:hypothetical protein